MWTRLYDESRTPAHWLDIIRPGEYCVFIMTASRRTPTDTEGKSFRTGAASVMVTPDLPEALRFARGVAKSHPELCCEIYDHEGK